MCGEISPVLNRAHCQQIPAWAFPGSPGSQSFFIYLQLSPVAGANKRLRLSCEGSSIPQPGPSRNGCEMQGQTHGIPRHGRTEATADVLRRVPNFHNDKYAHSAFQKACILSIPCVLRWPSKGGNYVNNIKYKKLLPLNNVKTEWALWTREIKKIYFSILYLGIHEFNEIGQDF